MPWQPNAHVSLPQCTYCPLHGVWLPSAEVRVCLAAELRGLCQSGASFPFCQWLLSVHLLFNSLTAKHMVCYLPVTHMIFYKNDHPNIDQQRRKRSKEMNSDISGNEIWISRKWNCRRWSWECWLPLLFWRQMCLRGTWCWKLTHIAERSGWDEQEDCPTRSYGKNVTLKAIVNRCFTTLEWSERFQINITNKAVKHCSDYF